jgi:hypothetical protein
MNHNKNLEALDILLASYQTPWGNRSGMTMAELREALESLDRIDHVAELMKQAIVREIEARD